MCSFVFVHHRVCRRSDAVYSITSRLTGNGNITVTNSIVNWFPSGTEKIRVYSFQLVRTSEQTHSSDLSLERNFKIWPSVMCLGNNWIIVWREDFTAWQSSWLHHCSKTFGIILSASASSGAWMVILENFKCFMRLSNNFQLLYIAAFFTFLVKV